MWIDKHIDEVFLGVIALIGVILVARVLLSGGWNPSMRAALRMGLLALAMWVTFNYLHNHGPWNTGVNVLVDTVFALVARAWHVKTRPSGPRRDEAHGLYQFVFVLLVIRLFWHLGMSFFDAAYAYALGNNITYIAMLAAVLKSAAR